ncbi:MAG: BrnT family toxin [Caldilineaceae bacterium]
MNLFITWNRQKARSNRRKHGVTFEEAASVFYDPLSLTVDDPLHSNDEDRFIIIGISTQRRILVVAHTDEGDVIKIISARLAESHERKQYEEGYYSGD